MDGFRFRDRQDACETLLIFGFSVPAGYACPADLLRNPSTCSSELVRDGYVFPLHPPAWYPADGAVGGLDGGLFTFADSADNAVTLQQEVLRTKLHGYAELR